ncbi:MAG TPA: hypothetical protein VH482_04695 [Thermomicrobiales bacterium]|jgi:hypothetical protein
MQQGTRSFGVARLGAVLLVLLAMASFVRVVPAAAQDNSITIDLKELNNSGVSGTATLTDNGDGTTTVSIQVDGATGDHPAHIHNGTCSDLDPNPKYPLANVDADGVSETDVDVSLDDLLAAPYAVNLHESPTNLGVYIACGEIVAPTSSQTGNETGGNETGGNTTSTSGGTLEVTLNELNDSGVSGTATLTDNGDGTTTVEIHVDGATGDHPAHIHQGTCDDLDPNPQYPLANIDANGDSTTDVEVSLDDLLASPHAVNLHQSADNIGTYIACGNIEAAGGETTGNATATVAPTPTETTATTAPDTGVGPTSTSSSNAALLAGLAALAVAMVLGGVALRRRREIG